MSETLDTAASNVRILLRDMDLSRTASDTPLEIYRTIMSKAQELALKTGLGRTWTESMFSCDANSAADYNLTELSYHTVYALRDRTNGRVMVPASQATIEMMREGITAATLGQGDPTAFALREDATQTVKVRFNCVPSRSISYDVLHSVLPTASYEDSAGTTTLPFEQGMLRTIEKAAALEIGRKLPQEERARLKLNPDVFDDWRADIKDGIAAEKQRQARMLRAPYGVGAVVG